MWEWFFPVQASTYAEKVDVFYYSLAAFVMLFTLGVVTVLIYLGTKYMKREGENRSKQVPRRKKSTTTSRGSFSCHVVMTKFSSFDSSTFSR